MGYHLMSGERFYGDYLVAPLMDFKEPPTGGSEFAASLRLSSIKQKTINFLSAEVKTKVKVPLRTPRLITPTCSTTGLRIIHPS